MEGGGGGWNTGGRAYSCARARRRGVGGGISVPSLSHLCRGSTQQGRHGAGGALLGDGPESLARSFGDPGKGGAVQDACIPASEWGGGTRNEFGKPTLRLQKKEPSSGAKNPGSIPRHRGARPLVGELLAAVEGELGELVAVLRQVPHPGVRELRRPRGGGEGDGRGTSVYSCCGNSEKETSTKQVARTVALSPMG